MPGIGPLGLPELLVLLVIVILIFGVGKLPEVGGALGRGIREFKQNVSAGEERPESKPAESDKPKA